jgi:hypothetical protein
VRLRPHYPTLVLLDMVTCMFGVILTGGSIGESSTRNTTRNSKNMCRTFDDKTEAQQYARRMNKLLSPGEKSYYRLKYKIVTLNS